MTQAASGIDLFIPEVYDIVWSLIILVIVAVFFYKFFMPKFNASCATFSDCWRRNE